MIATTGTRITAGVVRTGATPDRDAPAELLRQQLAAGRPPPPHLIMDRAGGWGKCRAEVDVVSQGQTVQVALIPTPGGADPNRFGPADFQLNAERTACTCPNGVVTTRLAPKVKADGLTARYLASDCRGCAFWTDCRGVDGKPKAQRTIFFTDHHAYLRQAAAFNQTPEGKALLARRWQVEPTVAWLTRYQGCRRARCLGQDAAQFQVFQACAMRNLLLWLSRCAPRRTPPLPPNKKLPPEVRKATHAPNSATLSFKAGRCCAVTAKLVTAKGNAQAFQNPSKGAVG